MTISSVKSDYIRVIGNYQLLSYVNHLAAGYKSIIFVMLWFIHTSRGDIYIYIYTEDLLGGGNEGG